MPTGPVDGTGQPRWSEKRHTGEHYGGKTERQGSGFGGHGGHSTKNFKSVSLEHDLRSESSYTSSYQSSSGKGSNYRREHWGGPRGDHGTRHTPVHYGGRYGAGHYKPAWSLKGKERHHDDAAGIRNAEDSSAASNGGADSRTIDAVASQERTIQDDATGCAAVDSTRVQHGGQNWNRQQQQDGGHSNNKLQAHHRTSTSTRGTPSRDPTIISCSPTPHTTAHRSGGRVVKKAANTTAAVVKERAAACGAPQQDDEQHGGAAAGGENDGGGSHVDGDAAAVGTMMTVSVLRDVKNTENTQQQQQQQQQQQYSIGDKVHLPVNIIRERSRSGPVSGEAEAVTTTRGSVTTSATATSATPAPATTGTGNASCPGTEPHPSSTQLAPWIDASSYTDAWSEHASAEHHDNGNLAGHGCKEQESMRLCGEHDDYQHSSAQWVLTDQHQGPASADGTNTKEGMGTQRPVMAGRPIEQLTTSRVSHGKSRGTGTEDVAGRAAHFPAVRDGGHINTLHRTSACIHAEEDAHTHSTGTPVGGSLKEQCALYAENGHDCRLPPFSHGGETNHHPCAMNSIGFPSPVTYEFTIIPGNHPWLGKFTVLDLEKVAPIRYVE